MSDIIKFPSWIRKRQTDLEKREEIIFLRETEIEIENRIIRSKMKEIRNQKFTILTTVMVAFSAGAIFGMILLMIY